MKLKGRVLAISGPATRMKKDQSGQYTIIEVDVQIGTYQRTRANYNTNTFETVTEADTIRKTYLNDACKGVQFAAGQVVEVEMHHYINKYGNVETVVDSIAVPQAQPAAPVTPPATNEPEDELPF